MQPRLCLRVLREQIPAPTQRGGGGLVSGKEDREDLVAQLSVAHAFSGLGITRCEQHREKVPSVDPVSPPLG